MSAGPAFDRAAIEKSLGPAAVEAARRNVASAPPLRPEQREFLRGLFASVPRAMPQARAADAA